VDSLFSIAPLTLINRKRRAIAGLAVRCTTAEKARSAPDFITGASW
jgi:hypothetical protein